MRMAHSTVIETNKVYISNFLSGQVPIEVVIDGGALRFRGRTRTLSVTAPQTLMRSGTFENFLLCCNNFNFSAVRSLGGRFSQVMFIMRDRLYFYVSVDVEKNLVSYAVDASDLLLSFDESERDSITTDQVLLSRFSHEGSFWEDSRGHLRDRSPVDIADLVDRHSLFKL